MLDLLAGLLEILPDELGAYLSSQLFRGLREPWNYIMNRIL